MKGFIISMALLLMTVSTATAEQMAESDIPFRISNYRISYDVKADGSFVENEHWEKTILKENVLESSKTAGINFSTSVGKGEILEAYTIKKSGQRIDAPKDSYQVTVNDGYKKHSPLYSDETTITVAFPDLAVGDTTVLSSRVTNSEGMFPNQFSVVQHLSRFTAYNDVSFEVTAPADMNLRYKSYLLTEQPALKKDGKQTLRWTYQGKTPEKWTPSDKGVTIIGEDPSLYISTFKNYEEIARAYGKRAIPKAAVTERVKKLAAEIAGSQSTTETQARAIYEWVAKNISYGGNCIGIGAVVPRDLDVVLDNKMGDCKDHATLLQALLAAKDIESEQSLINAGDLYQLPDIPVVSSVNHVINYVPRWNMFLDSTSSSTPYGKLPVTLGEKPTLLVSHYREGMKTPSTAQDGGQQILRTEIQIKEDGSATGKAQLSLKGIPGITLRALMRLIPREQRDLLAEKLLEKQGSHGHGTLTTDDPEPLLDTYNLTVSFKLDDFITVGTATALPIKPVMVTLLPIDGLMQAGYEPLPKKEHVCTGGVSVEEYSYQFPPSVKIVGLPKGMEVTSPIIDYKSTYTKSGNTVTVRREFKDKTATNVCSAEYAAEYKKLVLKVAKDVKSQILLGE